LVGSGRDLILRYHPGILPDRLRKTTKNLDQDSRSQVWRRVYWIIKIMSFAPGAKEFAL
jgi:hypothetical protein